MAHAQQRACAAGLSFVDCADDTGRPGAGGMGWYLKRNVLQIETERVTSILLSILVLVLISEILSALARDRVMRMK